MSPKLLCDWILSSQNDVWLVGGTANAFMTTTSFIKVRTIVAEPCLNSSSLSPSSPMLTEISNKFSRTIKPTNTNQPGNQPHHRRMRILKKTRNTKLDAEADDETSETHGSIAHLNLLLIMGVQTRNAPKMIISAERSPTRSNWSVTGFAPSGTWCGKPHSTHTSGFQPS